MVLDVEQYCVPSGKRIALDTFDPAAAKAVSKADRERVHAGLEADLATLRELHDRLHAERKQGLVIILMAIDTGGKDSTIDHIFSGLNPQGCVVASFGVPTEEELAHDFLWRVHQKTPRKGQIGIFNRSHYEDVTVVRVLGLIDTAERERRYEHIRDFEDLLTESGTPVLKFHLRISKDEQAQRLRDRIEDPSKHWKFDPNDLKERARWDAHQEAFEDAINATSTSSAPWYVIPANSKWYRDALVTRVVVTKLRQMDPQYPAPVDNIEQYVVD